MVTPRTLALVEMSSISAGTSFFSGTRRRITPSSAVYSSTLRRRSSTVPLARSDFACAITASMLAISVCVAAISAPVGFAQ